MSVRYKKNYSIDGWPIEDTKHGVVIDKEETIKRLNHKDNETKLLRKALKESLEELKQYQKTAGKMTCTKSRRKHLKLTN